MKHKLRNMQALEKGKGRWGPRFIDVMAMKKPQCLSLKILRLIVWQNNLRRASQKFSIAQNFAKSQISRSNFSGITKKRLKFDVNVHRYVLLLELALPS